MRRPHPSYDLLVLQRVVLILLITLAFLGRALAARQSTPVAKATEAAETHFGESIDVRVINLEAVVTDTKGRRVTGLGPDDFRLLVDGKEIEIAFFTEVQGGVAVSSERKRGTDQAVPAVMESGTPVGTNFLVFIDDVLSIGAQRNIAIDGLIAGLDQFGSTDQMAIVAYDGQLAPLLSWTASPTTLAEALAVAKQRRSLGIQQIAAQVNVGANEDQATTNLDLRTQNLTGATAAAVDREADRRYLGALEGLSNAVTRALRATQPKAGRNVLILLAGAWPTDLFNGGRSSYFGVPAELGSAQQIIDTANLTGHTIYPVGLAVPSAGRIGDRPIEPLSISGPLRGRSGDGAVGQAATVLGRAQAPHLDGLGDQSTLRVLASATGGRPLLFGKGRHALNAVVEDTRQYYWLGISPTVHGDGVRHRIRLEVLRPRLKVRGRRAYRDLAPDKEREMAVQSALLFGASAITSELTVTLDTPVLEHGNRMAVPIRVGIAAHGLSFLPSRDGVTAEAELRFGARDERGHTSNIATIPLRLTHASIPMDSQVFSYTSTIRMRDQHHDLIITLVDMATGNTATTSVTVAPTGNAPGR